MSKDKRGFAQGITHAAVRIGNTVAPSVVVVMMAAYGWRASFYGTRAFRLLWVPLWSVTFAEHPKDHPNITAAELALLPTPVPRATGLPWGLLFRRIVSPILGGCLIDVTGNRELPFVDSMVLMGLGVVLALRMRPNQRFEADTHMPAMTATKCSCSRFRNKMAAVMTIILTAAGGTPYAAPHHDGNVLRTTAGLSSTTEGMLK